MHIVIRAFGAEVLAVEIGDSEPADVSDEHDTTASQVEMPFGLTGDPWGHTVPDPDDRARRPGR